VRAGEGRPIQIGEFTNESRQEHSDHVPQLEVPEHPGGAGDGPREEREVQQLHDAVQDSVAAAAAESGAEALKQGRRVTCAVDRLARIAVTLKAADNIWQCPRGCAALPFFMRMYHAEGEWGASLL
jgi:hypothetical protein